MREIKKLWINEAVQIQFGFVSHTVGANSRVGMRTFSIVVELGFGADQFRGCEQLLQAGQGRRLLRRLKVRGGI